MEAVAGCCFFAYAEASECVAGAAGTGIGAGVRTGARLGKVGFGVRLCAGAGLLLGVGVGAGLGVRVGVGEGEVVGEVGDGVGLGLGDADVGLGLGDAVVGLGVGDGLTDAAAATTGKNATVPATRKPTMLTRRMHATRRRLAAADLGCPNLVLEILASKVTVASAP
jgi:hypothetical protein